METIGSQPLYSFVDGEEGIVKATNSKIREGRGHKVQSYMDLAKKVAELQFRNRDYVLLFRGQNRDYMNRESGSSIRPRIFRFNDKHLDDARDSFKRLREAERLLINSYKSASTSSTERIRRYSLARWSILQHYEVCATPLLDVSQSLRIAASFASDGSEDEAFIQILGVPNISGAITASAEAGIEIVRLSSVCPPEAVRPHIQEGFLLGEYPELINYSQRRHYRDSEMDFGHRLLAKFRFERRSFVNDKIFPMIAHEALYPDVMEDPLYELTESIKSCLG